MRVWADRSETCATRTVFAPSRPTHETVTVSIVEIAVASLTISACQPKRSSGESKRPFVRASALARTGPTTSILVSVASRQAGRALQIAQADPSPQARGW